MQDAFHALTRGISFKQSPVTLTAQSAADNVQAPLSLPETKDAQERANIIRKQLKIRTQGQNVPTPVSVSSQFWRVWQTDLLWANV